MFAMERLAVGMECSTILPLLGNSAIDLGETG
jgi:hypothetical protein